jgi:hypothetical protein
LTETYSSLDKNPFGTFVAKQIMKKGFPDTYIQDTKGPFDKMVSVFNDTSSIYFCISRNLFVEPAEVNAILKFVYDGNTAFISAANFDSTFLQKIFCKVSGEPDGMEVGAQVYRRTSASLIRDIHTSSDSFGYYYKPFSSCFSEINNLYSRVAGYNEGGNPNCIIFFWGKGKLFLHTDPRGFSNYFLLTGSNFRYLQEWMQVLTEHPQHIFWDDYYHKQRHPKRSGTYSNSLNEIFKYPGLQAAFWLLICLLLFYILFNLKRNQRIIKLIKPNLNTSVAFTETIARLYLQEHDNKNIADKMITYFNEFIRSNYYLQLNTGDPEFISILSRKSGVPPENVRTLFEAIRQSNKSIKIDDDQLLSLNEQIQQFYKKRQ